jgi:S-adenosylmethionine:tRNA ribosyltransferase-isomerase
VLLDDFDYVLPPAQIAQRPLADRDGSRMLLLERQTGAFEDRQFGVLPDLLRGDELIIVNNARVIPARLFGRRAGVHSSPPSHATVGEHLTGTVEVFLTRQLDSATWEALVRPGRKIRTGERIVFGEGELGAEIIARGELGARTVKFVSKTKEEPLEHIYRLGHVPLPPYIDRADESSDRERYQTVFAKQAGAVAAPTAGLHFTPGILERIRKRGAEICELTLNVGLGTFQPIHVTNLEEHRIHSESYEIPESTAEQINRARAAKRPILAIGTTVVRALENSAQESLRSGASALVQAGPAEARIFILPGFEFRVVDALLTNFHLPRSSLFALVCAFAGRERVLAAYEYAVQAGYRFYSYGDCMLIR